MASPSHNPSLSGSARPRVWAAKRGIDLFGGGLGLLMLSPVLGGVAIAVGATMGRPVLFRQDRPGRDGVPFKLRKFRSMRDPRPGEEGAEFDGARITRLGAFLRSTSLDELPTLLNVFFGDMSLVGPRPLLVRYLARYSPEQARRHAVRPGITGWAQVHGRNAITWEEKLRHDIWYVDNGSLWIDIKVLVLTLKKVFVREGISSGEHATMPEFMGSSAATDVTPSEGG